jgi:hypothetical protein
VTEFFSSSLQTKFPGDEADFFTMNLPYCILADAVKGEMEAIKAHIQVIRAHRTVHR